MALPVRRLVGTASVTFLLLLSACASLRVDPDPNAGKPDVGPIEDSLTYNLAETTIVVSGTVTLNDCDSIIAQKLVDNDNANAAAAANGPPTHVETLPPSSPPVDVSSTFAVAATQEADPSFQFQIPYSSLEGWTKQLNLTVGRNSNKTLLSINGTITDQAGPIILAAAQTAIAIGGAVAVPELTPLSVASKTALTSAAMEEHASSRLSDALKKRDFRQAFALTRPGMADARIDLRSLGLRALQLDNKALTPPAAPTVCNDRVEEGLKAIADQEVIIANGGKPTAQVGVSSPPPANSSAIKGTFQGTFQGTLGSAGGPAPASAGNPAAGGDGPPGSGQGGGQTNPEVLRAQTRITELQAQYQLTRQFTITWTPSRANDFSKVTYGDRNYILKKDYDLYTTLISPAWLTTPVPALAAGSDVFKQLQRRLTLEVYVQPWTVGHVYGDSPLTGGPTIESKPDKFPDGIVYRDPALATLRACLGPCAGTPTAAGGSSVVGAADDLNNDLVETTTDVMPATSVSVIQLGRVYVQPLKNVLFQTSSATLTLNADGSIASVGTQSSNAAASGFAAATAAAGAQSGAVAARNTGVAAQNTVVTTQATLADTVNKAAADCLQQAQQIIAAGKKPPMSCP